MKNTKPKREKNNSRKKRKTTLVFENNDLTNEDSHKSISSNLSISLDLRLKEDDDMSNFEIRRRKKKNNNLICEEKFDYYEIENKSMIVDQEYDNYPTQEELDNKYNEIQNILENEQLLFQNRKFDYMSRQPHINPMMRTILLDWLMDVSCNFKFKRNTYHSAVVLMDIYLSKVINVSTNLLQLIGVVCLSISAKNEEVLIPTMSLFSMCTDSAYSTSEIIEYERNILISIMWKINYPTISFWANFITTQWDEFAKNFYYEYPYDINRKKIKLPISRNRTVEEYSFFRDIFQILDLISLDIECLNYSDKILITCVIYLNLGIYLKHFTQNDIINEFTKDINAYTNYNDLNIVYNRFLNNCLDIELDDIVDHLCYVSYFFFLELNYVKSYSGNEDSVEPTYEEFLQFQTYNKLNIDTINYINSIRGNRS